MQYFKSKLIVALFLLLLPVDTRGESAAVGVIMPLTGDAQALGESFRNGVTMALEKLSPVARERLNLLLEDDGMQPKLTLSAFQKLRQQHELAAVVTFASPTSKAVAPLTEKEKIPLIAVASDPEIVRGGHYTVNLWVTPQEEARAAIAEFKLRGYKRIARVSTTHIGFYSLREALTEQAAGAFDFIADEEFPGELRDFRAFLSRLRQRTDIDVIAMMLISGQNGLFARQARELGIQAPLFGFELFEDPTEVANSNGALIGQSYVNADVPTDVFAQEYRRRFPKASPFGADIAHDAILLLGAAVERGTDRETINHYLHTVRDFHGAAGVFSASGDNRFTLPATVKVVTADGFERLHPR